MHIKMIFSATSLGDILYTIVAVTALALFVKFIQLMQYRWKFQNALKDFPAMPRGIPFIGHSKAFLDGARGCRLEFDNIYDNNEKAMQVWLTPFTPGVVVYHPDTIRPVFNTAEPKNDEYGFFLPWLGDGLLLASGEKWGRNRRLLTPAFHFDILKPYVAVFLESADHLVTKWKELCNNQTRSIDVIEDTCVSTLDSLMKCVMGVKDDIHKMGMTHPYAKASVFLSWQILLRFGNLFYRSDWIYALSSHGRANRQACKTAHEYSEKTINDRKKALQQPSSNESSKSRLMPFIDILLQCKDENGVGLSDIEIRNEVDTFMFEGHDTTASGLSWIVYNLAQHPELQERCRKEVDEVMEDIEDNDLKWNDLPKFEYLTMFIKESFRLHPPVPFVGRKLQSPVQLPDGRIIPKGTVVNPHMNGVHRNPNVWKDPLVFDPQRFSQENSVNRDPHAFLPFAAGPRNCIGQHFAMAEMKVFTSVLLRHFRFSADSSKPVQRINESILRSTTGIHVMITPRDYE